MESFAQGISTSILPLSHDLGPIAGTLQGSGELPPMDCPLRLKKDLEVLHSLSGMPSHVYCNLYSSRSVYNNNVSRLLHGCTEMYTANDPVRRCPDRVVSCD